MKILVTNDDSIKSEGLIALAKLAKKYGEVFIVAPLYEQSAKSHAINVHDGFEVEKIDLGIDIEAYTCNSTPADCVRSAYYGLKRDFDIVFSGINNGLNTGEDIAYSGTVAAATEACLLNKKALAFSTYPNSFNSAILVFDRIMNYIFMNNLLEIGNLYNINIPLNPKGIKITKQGNTHFDTRFDKEGNLFYQRGNHRFYLDKDNLNSDVWAMVNNYISISPLNFDRTDFTLFQKLNK